MTLPPVSDTIGAVHVEKFFIRQKITLMVNRYEITAARPDGSAGEVLAFAEQKRLKLREEINFFTDSTQSHRLFSFKARQRLDVHAEHDVFDAQGEAIGYFKKEFGKSLLRSTWHLSAPGVDALGQERRPVLAVVRRVWSFLPVLGDVWVPFVFHFDFTDKSTGRPVLSSERRKSIRDQYTVTVPDPQVDFRLAAAMAVALDALQSR